MKRIIAVLLTLLILASLTTASFAAADAETADTGAGKITVTLLDITHDNRYAYPETRTFNVGDTFSVYTFLDVSASTNKSIAAISGTQFFDSDKLELDAFVEEIDDYIYIGEEEYPEMYPIIGNGSCVTGVVYNKHSGRANLGGLDASVGINVSTPAINQGFWFNNRNCIFSKYTYRVIGSGETSIKNYISSAALADTELTRVIIPNKPNSYMFDASEFQKYTDYRAAYPGFDGAIVMDDVLLHTTFDSDPSHIHLGETVREYDSYPTATSDGWYHDINYCTVCGEEFRSRSECDPATGEEPELLTDANLTLSSYSGYYYGTKHSVEVTVRNAAGEELVEGRDYLPQDDHRPDNDLTEAGVYNFRYEGVGNYTGVFSRNYTIKPQPLKSTNSTLNVSTLVYTGKQRNPKIIVKNVSGEILTEGVHYTVERPEGRTLPGRYKYRIIGIGNYNNTVAKTLTITGQLSDFANVSFDPSTCTYNGKQRNPAVVVTDKQGNKLTKDTHYTLEIPEGRNDAGSYTYRVTGKGIYTGTIEKSFTIKRQPLSSDRMTLSMTRLKATGKQRNVTVVVRNAAGERLTQGVDYTLTIPAGRTLPGDYVYTVKGIGNYSGTASKTLTLYAE